MGLISIGLQFVVAGCALRLNRLFGTARVGWSLFFAFALLALLHLVQSMPLADIGEQQSVQTDVIYSLVSMLLLTGLFHIEIVLKERLLRETEEQRLRAELESEVRKKTAYLTRAIEELQAEIDERKRLEEETGIMHKELLATRHAGKIAAAQGKKPAKTDKTPAWPSV